MIEIKMVQTLSTVCKDDKELRKLLKFHKFTIKTNLAGEHTQLPPYYFKSSPNDGFMQRKDWTWYNPLVKEEL